MKPFFVLLLPFMLLVCGAASAPGQKSSPKAQAEAVAAIEKLGGRVRLDAKSGEATVGLHNTQITDAGLTEIKAALPKCNVQIRRTQS